MLYLFVHTNNNYEEGEYMKTLVILGHLDYSKSKVNKRLAEELRECNEVTLHNLNEEYPDENINKDKEQKLLLEYDRIIFQFPFYWYSTPHILKKWQDVVLEYGWAFGPNGTALKGKEFLCAITIGGPEDSYQSGGYNNYSISELLKPIQQMANLTGMKFLAPFKIHSSVVLTEEQLEIKAKEYPKYILDPDLNPEVALERIKKELENNGGL